MSSVRAHVWKSRALLRKNPVLVRNHPHAALRSLRHLLTQGVDAFTEVDRLVWYELTEEFRKRDAAACLRRASGKIGDRSNSEGDRSNFEGDRGKSFGFAAASAASPANS